MQYTPSAEDFDTKDGLLSGSSSSAGESGTNSTTSARNIAQFYGLLTSSIEGNIRNFCNRIPNVFSDAISPADIELLFQNSCLELFMLRLAYRYVIRRYIDKLSRVNYHSWQKHVSMNVALSISE